VRVHQPLIVLAVLIVVIIANYFDDHSLDKDLKKMETGPRWPPDSSLYLAYIRELQDRRQRDLLLSMHVKCSERWFLLQLMKKYAGN